MRERNTACSVQSGASEGKESDAQSAEQSSTGQKHGRKEKPMASHQHHNKKDHDHSSLALFFFILSFFALFSCTDTHRQKQKPGHKEKDEQEEKEEKKEERREVALLAAQIKEVAQQNGEAIQRIKHKKTVTRFSYSLKDNFAQARLKAAPVTIEEHRVRVNSISCSVLRSRARASVFLPGTGALRELLQFFVFEHEF